MEESSLLQYLYANNLNGWAISQALPENSFTWISNIEEFTTKQIVKLVKKKKHGYIPEANVDYLEELHNMRKELPFMVEKIKINKVGKLAPNLNNRKKCVVQIRGLDQALDHGLMLKKRHRLIKFEQSAWLKGYIDLHKRLRTQATNDFAMNFFMIMNNIAFGKTMVTTTTWDW